HRRGRRRPRLGRRVRSVLDGAVRPHPTRAGRADRSALGAGRSGRSLRVLVVSGIWPPDVGGPASHAPDVAAFLRTRGHDVEVVITAAASPAAEPYPVHWIARSLPKGLVHVRTGLEVARRARRADVVYTTGMFGRSALG